MDVHSVQLLLRVLYKDGTVSVITVAPQSPHDALESLSTSELDTWIGEQLVSQHDTITTAFNDFGSKGLYDQVKKDVAARKARQHDAAGIART